MDEDDRERPEPLSPGDEEVGDLDRERPDSPSPGDEEVDELDPERPEPATPGHEEEVDDLDRGAHLDAPPRDVGRVRGPATASADRGRSEQHRWRRWAWWALIIATVGGGWVLVLATIFIARSGDRTAELISLFEAGQQQREAASGGAQESQEERQAALKAQQQQSQTFRAQELAALADQAKSNAEARLALANAALAESRIDQADAEAALAQVQAEVQARKADQQPAAKPATGSDRQLQADALGTLAAAIEALRDAIDGGPERCPGNPSKPQGCITGGVDAPPGP